MSSQARFVMIERKTRLTELVERFNTWSQARFYLEHAGMDVSDFLAEHDQYKAVLARIESTLKPMGRVARIERQDLETYQFHSEDIVIVVGQDGLVANTIKYLNGQVVVGVNPDTARWDGQLLPFQADDVEGAVGALLKGQMNIADIRLAEAKTNDGQRMLAVNDLFIGPKTHSSARYQIDWNGLTETHSSSGIIVSTGLGRTGWLTSVLAGAQGLMGENTNMAEAYAMQWDSNFLYFAVREPFPSQMTQSTLVSGKVDRKKPLALTSLMPSNGVIFSDGMESDAITFNAGTQLRIGVAPEIGQLVKA